MSCGKGVLSGPLGQTAGEWIPANLGGKFQLELNFNDIDNVITSVAPIQGEGDASAILDTSNSTSKNNFGAPDANSAPLYRGGKSAIFDGVNNIMLRDASASTITSDTQGEFFFVCQQPDPYQTSVFFSLADSSRTDEYVMFGIEGNLDPLNDTDEGNRLFMRYREQSSPNYKTMQADLKFYSDNLEYTFFGVSSDGSTIRMYQNGVELSVTDVTGTSAGEWLADVDSADTFAIGALEIATQARYYTGIKYIGYCNEVLSDTERTNWYEWAVKEFFQSLSSPTLAFQNLTQTDSYADADYHWTGSLDINPVTGNVLSVFDYGATHYLNDDLHTIGAQRSTDGGVTYGPKFDITPADAVNQLSYTNPSMGYGNDGRLHVIYTVVDHSGGDWFPVGLRYRYSDDDGDTWSSEGVIGGIQYTEILNSNAHIIRDQNGNLLCPYYEVESFTANRALLNVLRSVDNGLTWQIYSNIDTQTWGNANSDEPINETSIYHMGDGNIVALTRVNARAYFNQYLSTDNGATWTKQGQTKLGEFFQRDGATGTQSQFSTLARIDGFTLDGTEVVCAIFANKGGSQFLASPYYNDTYYRLVFARVKDLIRPAKGVNAWESGAPIKFKISGETQDLYDGYPAIRFFGGAGQAFIRTFIDYGDPVQTQSSINYLRYNFPLDWLRRILAT